MNRTICTNCGVEGKVVVVDPGALADSPMICGKCLFVRYNNLVKKYDALGTERDVLKAEASTYKEKYLLLSSQHVREIEELEAQLARYKAALSEALQFLPTESEMLDYASLNEGRVAEHHVVAQKIRRLVMMGS